MSDTDLSGSEYNEPGLYIIRIKGHLAGRWAAWFEGFAITEQANGDTLLSGTVLDQAALHGLLRKVRDSGMPLIAVARVPADEEGAVQPTDAGDER